MADHDRLIQVMLNLLSNAVKFCPPVDGRVAVRLYREDDNLRVDVLDNGSGIEPAEQKLIFEKFRQMGDTMTAKPQGTGLGLPISRQIIEHFGGRLWVESATGQGATFSFALPLNRNHRNNRQIKSEERWVGES
jgi:signal transduction histidine kinase